MKLEYAGKYLSLRPEGKRSIFSLIGRPPYEKRTNELALVSKLPRLIHLFFFAWLKNQEIRRKSAMKLEYAGKYLSLRPEGKRSIFSLIGRPPYEKEQMN